MRNLTGQPRGAGPGFTLIELLLVVVLLMLLTGAAVFNFSALQRSAQLEEGAARLETVLRFARAQAATTGRRVQVVFQTPDTSTGSNGAPAFLRVEWEPDPLAQPGVFEELPEVSRLADGLEDLIAVASVQVFEAGTEPEPASNALGSEAPAPTPGEAGAPDASFEWEMWETFAPILFHPDGSSDAAEVVVMSQDADDTRRIVLRLQGITGVIRRAWLGAEPEEEVAETAEQPARGPAESGKTNQPPDEF